MDCIHILNSTSFLLTGCVTLGKALDLSELPLFGLQYNSVQSHAIRVNKYFWNTTLHSVWWGQRQEKHRGA